MTAPLRAFAFRHGPVALLPDRPALRPHYPLRIEAGRAHLSLAANRATVDPSWADTGSESLAGCLHGPRPARRGECLTSARRADLIRLYIEGASGCVADPYPDGWNCSRPCPFVGCKYHLALDYNEYSGNVTLMLAEHDADIPEALERIAAALAIELAPYHPHDMSLHTCALDVADIAREGGPLTLEAVGRTVGKVRERMRQVEFSALRRIKDYLVTPERIYETDLSDITDARDTEQLDNGLIVPVYRRGIGTAVVQCANCSRRYNVRLVTLRKSADALCRLCSAP